jgi:LuxR family transcriptional regulator, maltose regulon positive regulatory protein
LVIAARSDPPLPLGRLRARGELAELRAADLRFTTEESAALLLHTASKELDVDTLAALQARTEGWAVGLQLAGLSLQQHDNPHAFVAGFSGTHRFVLDFLTEEVLARQPQSRVRFLLETSVLEELSGDLCDAVTGGVNSQDVLEGLERDNVFLISLDEVRHWWRYHHLFADLLQSRLRQTDPERVSVLHRNAARWFEARGQIDQAMHHALGSSDADWAARLVEQHAQVYLMRNESATVRRWLSALPPELVRARARLGLTSAILAKIGGRLEDVEVFLAQADTAYARDVQAQRHSGSSEQLHGMANVVAMLPLQRAEVARRSGDADAVIELCRLAEPAVDADDRYLHFVLRWERAMAAVIRGQLAEAEQALAGIADERWADGDAYSAVYACCARSQAQRALGDLQGARRTCEDAIQSFGRLHPGAPLPSLGIARIGLAEALLEQGSLDAALQQASTGSELCQQLSYARWQKTGRATLARVLLGRGDVDGALAILDEVTTAPPNMDAWIDQLNPAPVERARALLSQGNVLAIEQWLHGRGIDELQEPTYDRERAYLVLARVLLARGAPERALVVLQKLGDLARRHERMGCLREIRVLEAVALDTIGERSAALAVLKDAVISAEPEIHIRIFVDGGTRVDALLDELRPVAISSEFIGRLRRALHRTVEPAPLELARPARVPLGQGLANPLSDRELEVLALLASGMSNQQIADVLVVALDTVKKHVSHILDKLESASRTQAVARARDLAIL